MTFLYPQIFVYIFLPSIILFYFVISKKPGFLKIFSDEVYQKLSLAQNSFMGRNTRITLSFAALFFMLIALSRPVIDRGEKEIVSKGAKIVIGLDISLSMDSEDIYPSRLKASIHKIKKLLESIKSDKIAVVAFAKDSYVISPMTKDKNVVSYLLDIMDISRFNDRSSNMPAIIEAAKMLSSSDNPTLLILSDGDEGELEEIRDQAKENGIRLYALGMATNNGVPIPDGNGGYINDNEGNIVITGLNPSLKKLALSSGGAYIDYSVASDDIIALFEQIKNDIKSNEFEKEKIHDYQELFYFPLGFALFLLLIAFHSFSSRSVAVAVLVLTFQTDAKSASFDFEQMTKAKEAYSAGKFADALKSYDSINGLDDDSEARRLYNIGNTQYRLGDFDKAIESYESSLSLAEDEDTKYNLDIAKKRKKEQEKKEQENSDQDKKEEDKNEKDKKKQDSEENNKKQDKDGQKKEQEGKKKGEQENDKNNKDASNAGQKEDQKHMSDAEEKKWLKELDKKPNPMPLKNLPVSKGESSAKNW